MACRRMRASVRALRTCLRGYSLHDFAARTASSLVTSISPLRRVAATSSSTDAASDSTTSATGAATGTRSPYCLLLVVLANVSDQTGKGLFHIDPLLCRCFDEPTSKVPRKLSALCVGMVG